MEHAARMIDDVLGHVELARLEHEVAYLELSDFLRKHAGTLSPMEMLAAAANMVGKLIAMQDPLTMSPEQAMATVSRNIEVGNAQAHEEGERMRLLLIDTAASRA